MVSDVVPNVLLALLDLKKESSIPGVTIGTLLMLVLFAQLLKTDTRSREASQADSSPRSHRATLKDKVEVGDRFYLLKEGDKIIAYKVGGDGIRFTRIIPSKLRSSAYETNQDIRLREISENDTYIWELVPKAGSASRLA